MNKRLKVMASVMAALVVSTALFGCGKKPAEGGNAPAEKKEGKKIVIWSHLKTEEVKEVEKYAKEWAEKTGNTVEVKEDKSDFQAYLQAANSSKAPDVMFGLAHDNLGTFQKANLLAEVPANVMDDAKFEKNAVNAVTIEGKKYAVPVLMETYALFYNTDKIKEAPKTLDDLVKVGKEHGFKYEINNFYFSYAFLAANGGYVYKFDGQKFDPADIGLGNEGAVKGYDYLQSLVQTHKLMPSDIKGDLAKGDFQAQKTGLYISGPWDVNGLKDAKVPFAIAPLPGVDGKPMPSFMGVQAAFVSSKSKNQTEAWDAVKYILEKSENTLFKVGYRIPATKAGQESAEFKNDKFLSAFAEQAKYAQPMPNIPAVQAMWTPGENNLKLLTSGKQNGKQTGENLVKQVKEGIAQQK